MSRRGPSLVSRQIGRLAPMVMPGLLLAALLLGGASREAPLPNLVLQAVAAMLCLCAVWVIPRHRLNAPAAALLLLTLGFCLWSALALIPLPSALWTVLPGRAEVAAGLAALEAPLPALPLSLSPERTASALAAALVPLAVLLCGLALSWRDLTAHLRTTLVGLSALAALLGLVQVLTGSGGGFYPYATTNFGMPVGSFANSNHFGSLMLVSLPFVAALASKVRLQWAVGDQSLGAALMIGAAALMIGLGLAACGSLAVYILSVPAVALSILIYRGERPGRRDQLLALGGALAMGGIAAALSLSPLLAELGLNRDSHMFIAETRPEIFARTAAAVGAHLPFGTGLGSFTAVYPQFEDPSSVGNTYINQAHNEYLQIPLELGVPGIALLVLAGIWWGVMSWRIWTARKRDDLRLQKAASVTLFLLAAHSLVDYPLRTAALAALAMLCAVLMCGKGGDGRRRGAEEAAVDL